MKRSINIDRRTGIGWLAVLIGLMLAGMSGCGKKAPPVPPARPPLAPVTDLQGRLDGDTVTLTWRRDPDVRGISAYVILRAQTSASDPPCPGCPLVFQRAGRVGVDDAEVQFEFSQPVPEGFVYTYKVQPVGSSGDAGQESNRVVIDRSPT